MNDRFLLTLILIGQPELRDIIKDIKQLDQRIAIKYHLSPLSTGDSARYILTRLKVAGASRRIFASGAFDEIYQHSLGIPRKINNICDMSLMVGFADKTKMIDADVVRNVIKDLYQD